MNGTTPNTQLLSDARRDSVGGNPERVGVPQVDRGASGGPSRWTARTVGILVLGGYLTYGVGSALATGVASAPGYLSELSTSTTFSAGALLMLVNSALVVGIGALMFPILRPHSQAIAVGYLATRIFEGILLAVGVVSLLTLVSIGRSSIEAGASGAAYLATLAALASNGNFLAYNVAMAGLGVGSIFFCLQLVRANLVPRFLGVWGAVGYAVFAAGCLLELVGVAGAGLVTVVPGGLFEVFFGLWLIVKGFNRSARVSAV